MTEPSDHVPLPTTVTLAQELRGFSGKLKRRLREQDDGADLTPSQTAVLLRLEQGPATTSGLARAEGMRPQSMGTIIAALEAAGLVEGSPDPKDGRQTILSMTEECRSRIAHGRAVRQDWLMRTIDATLSPQEQEQLLAALPLLQRLVGDPA